MQENQLQVIVKESGLEPAKAQFILTKFQNYFAIAADWEVKAKSIIVTSETQTAEMEMARTGRLFLREKRVAVEKARKELKEQALREGKAIDGIANVLKALIVPIEDYLEQQEKFVEIREAKKAEQLRIEVERRIEEERIAKEKADAEALEKARAENERLKAEAMEREAEAEKERLEQARVLAEQKAKAEKERQAIEDAARIEREKQNRLLVAEQEKAQKAQREAEMKAKQAQADARAKEQQLRAKADAEKKERERLQEQLSRQVECPFCHKKFVPSK